MQRLIGRRSGGSVKIIVLNDCCREDYQKLRKSMETEEEHKLRLDEENKKLQEKVKARKLEEEKNKLL